MPKPAETSQQPRAVHPGDNGPPMEPMTGGPAPAAETGSDLPQPGPASARPAPEASPPPASLAEGGALRPGSGIRGLRNSLLVLCAQLASRLLALGTVIVTLRSLGAGPFGEMQTAVTYGAIISVIADLGLSTLYTREGARHPELIGRYLDTMVSLRLPMLVLAILVLIGALWVVGLHALIVAAAALLVASGLQLVLRNTFYALQRVRFVAVEIVPEAMLLLGLVVVGALHHLDASYFIWAYTFSYIAAAIYFGTTLILLGYWRPRVRFDAPLVRGWLRMTLPLAVSYVFTTVYWQVDVPILQHFGPSTLHSCPTPFALSYCEVGWYQAAYRPFQALLVIPFALRAVAFPLLSIYHRQAPEQLRVAVRKLFKALVALGLPVSVGIIVLADQYTALFGLYPEAAPALRLLGITVVFMFIANTYATALIAMDRQRVFAWIVGCGMVVNVVLNAVLIPVFEGVRPGSGYLVTSANTAATEMVLVVIGLVALRRAGATIPVLASSWRMVPPALVMGGFLLLAHPEGRVATVLLTFAAAVIYLAGLWLIGAADAEERRLLRRALSRT
jgi:O-antigen/teichoic acid export membrane protein